ncbi:oxidoreductase [Luteitalea sp. TBR-22]|uniref:proton-conducting transporter transmembrane domain-containing protein n=1 Tax=Luteitalea sp. TBR-22 TaxID=2802971 RepID=UPI001AFABAA4|nr:proton-conducting transporter membrane subunit [Luteitalea sp. TBR-22]BCS34859.1 oxidoreductase [Luteitalea sp. TBR-22]
MDALTSLAPWLLAGVVVAPGALFVVMGLLWLAGGTLSERAIGWLGALMSGAMLLALAAVWWVALAAGWAGLHVDLGHWFAVGAYEFPVRLVADGLSLPLVTLTVLLAGVIGHFSHTYLHREKGFYRFFTLLHLFTCGALVVFTAGSLDLLVAGWELVGLTSVLLIAFFHERPEPVEGGLRVFGVYRASDLGLLVAVFLLHHWAGTSMIGDTAPALTAAQATLVSLLLLLAAAGKSAQVPFSGWLPRAMEGPTPSSAIFYGAISVQLGAYLLLRLQPLLATSRIATVATVIVGLLTAVHGTLAGRAAADAKTSLAHAALTQVGLVFVEIGLGFTGFAVLHMTGHALVRTLQFLRAPSMLHDHHQMHAAVGGHLTATGGHFERLLPEPVQWWAYRLAVDRSHLDTLIDRLVIEPLHALSVWLGRIDEWTSRPPGVPADLRAASYRPPGAATAGGRADLTARLTTREGLDG